MELPAHYRVAGNRVELWVAPGVWVKAPCGCRACDQGVVLTPGRAHIVCDQSPADLVALEATGDLVRVQHPAGGWSWVPTARTG